MTIREKIITAELANMKDRLNKLEAMNAPQIVIDGTKQEVERLEAGNIKIGGDVKLLDMEWTSSKVQKGRGGKVFIRFNGFINYFPQARYGRFIAEDC